MMQDTDQDWSPTPSTVTPTHRSGAERPASKQLDQPNVLRTLERDHQTIRDRFRKLHKMPSRNGFDKAYRELRAELLAHLEAEEATFYSRLLRVAEPLASHCASEHQQVQDILRALDLRPSGNERWMDLFSTLEACIETHFAHEEGVVFQLALDVMSATDLARIDADFRQVRRVTSATNH